MNTFSKIKRSFDQPKQFCSCKVSLNSASKVLTRFESHLQTHFACSWTLLKSTLFKSLSIWKGGVKFRRTVFILNSYAFTCAIWELFCRTALAAWAKWFSPVYRLNICERDFTALILISIRSGESFSVAVFIQPSRFLAKFLIDWVKAFGMDFNTYSKTLNILILYILILFKLFF